MDVRIDGRKALVTGGSLGIGRATAFALAASGASVAISARDGERLRQVAEEISGKTGARVVAVPGDMSSKEDIERVISAANEALGHVDILVNNAGSSPAGNIFALSDELWKSSFDLKLMGYVRCARAVLPGMMERRWGRIVNIAGKGGEIATAGYLLGSFNAAVIHFSRSLAREGAPRQVLVNCINPGGVNTPRLRSIIEQKAKTSGRPQKDVEAEWNATVPLGRMAEPEDIADLITFLCSERARHICGAVLNIDGCGTGGV